MREKTHISLLVKEYRKICDQDDLSEVFWVSPKYPYVDLVWLQGFLVNTFEQLQK